MGRVVSQVLPRAPVATGLVLVAALLAGALPAMVAAQEPPACGDDGPVSECRLPGWPAATIEQTPSFFGTVTADAGTWVVDEVGDAPDDGLDILAVGVARIDIDDPAAIRAAPELLRLGKAKKAVRDGRAVLVRVVLDRPLDAITAGHAGVHVATDIDGARHNNAPAAVGAAEAPFAGTQDVYSATYATTTEQTKLLDSDLSKRWYRGRDQFAAAWSAPDVLDVLMRPQAFGEGLRVISYTSGDGGGYDTVTLGPAAIPVDGRVGLVAACAESSIANEPFTVGRLVENGQTLRNVEARASWLSGAMVPVDPEALAALRTLDEDGDGHLSLPSTASLFEDGRVIRQRPSIELALDEETVQLALELGLTRRGYNVLRAIDVRDTGSEIADAYLESATGALIDASPPFRSTKLSGPVSGEPTGTCATSLIEVPPPEPAASAPATDASSEADDTAATD